MADTRTAKPSTCGGCPLYIINPMGFMPEVRGTGEYEVMLVGEALGENEERESTPFVGKAGLKLATTLSMRGLEIDKFHIANVISCRPPDNHLVGAPYEHEAIARCAPYLDKHIATCKPKVIVAMGATAMRRVLDLPNHAPLDDKRDPQRGYVNWSNRYGCWVIATYHPAFLLRGNAHLTGVFLYDIEHAVEIAREGFQHVKPEVLVDPPLDTFSEWISTYEAADGAILAFDIETPHKEQRSEDDLEFEDPSYTITRIGFCYDGQHGVSLAWAQHYLPYVKQLLAGPGDKVAHNGRYDIPRLIRNNCPVNGRHLDSMWAWHVMNSDLRMALGYIAPMLAPTRPRWKNEAHNSPGYYNGCDAVVTSEIITKLLSDLEKHGLTRVYMRHIVELDTVLEAMSRNGLQIDPIKRTESSRYLIGELERVQGEMTLAVPDTIRTMNPKMGYVREPADTSGLVQHTFNITQRECEICGATNPSKKHWGRKDRKRDVEVWGRGHTGEIHERTVTLDVERWVRLEPFSPSNVQMKRYLLSQKQAGISKRDKKTKRVSLTFNDEALKLLMARYPKDPIYPRASTYRDIESTLKYTGWLQEDGTFDGGLQVDINSRAHTTFTHRPSTLRLACQEPPLHQIPKGMDSDYQKLVRQVFIADGNELLLECDYRAIEAQLVGYEAIAADGEAGIAYIRLAKLGVHDFLNAHILQRNGKITEADVPQLKWSDDDLRGALKVIKRKFPNEREAAKRIVHGTSYGATAGKVYQLYPEYFSSKPEVGKLKQVFYEVCPAVPKWQKYTVARAGKEGHLRNPFGYLHRFWDVLQWKRDPDGEWRQSWADGAKAALAFGPQSTAAAIIKEAMLRMRERALNGQMRLQVHDSLLFGLNQRGFEEHAQDIIDTMQQPVVELKLPDGSLLSIEVEAKVGRNWGSMEDLGS